MNEIKRKMNYKIVVNYGLRAEMQLKHEIAPDCAIFFTATRSIFSFSAPGDCTLEERGRGRWYFRDDQSCRGE